MCIYSVGWSHIRIAEQKGLRLGVTHLRNNDQQRRRKVSLGSINTEVQRHEKPMAKY